MGACAISLNLGHRLVERRFLTRGGRSSSISRMVLMAKLVDVGSIGCYFESLSDPRHTRNRKHLLVDIAVISVCGILCGCDGLVGYSSLGRTSGGLVESASHVAQRHSF